MVSFPISLDILIFNIVHDLELEYADSLYLIIDQSRFIVLNVLVYTTKETKLLVLKTALSEAN